MSLPSPSDFSAALFLGLLVMAFFGLAGLINSVTAIIERYRRKPSLDSELAHLVRRPELQEVDRRLSAEVSDVRKHHSASNREIYKRLEEDSAKTRQMIADLGKSLDSEFRTLYRALGKVEGVTLEERGNGR